MGTFAFSSYILASKARTAAGRETRSTDAASGHHLCEHGRQQLPTDEDFTVTISFKNTGKSAALEAS
jgi:hypothetical protein